MVNEVEHVLAAQNKLGEGPVWSSEEQALYWVDIESNCFCRLYPTTGKYEVFDVGVPVGVLAFEKRIRFLASAHRAALDCRSRGR